LADEFSFAAGASNVDEKRCVRRISTPPNASPPNPSPRSSSKSSTRSVKKEVNDNAKYIVINEEKDDKMVDKESSSSKYLGYMKKMMTFNELEELTNHKEDSKVLHKKISKESSIYPSGIANRPVALSHTSEEQEHMKDNSMMVGRNIFNEYDSPFSIAKRPVALSFTSGDHEQDYRNSALGALKSPLSYEDCESHNEESHDYESHSYEDDSTIPTVMSAPVAAAAEDASHSTIRTNNITYSLPVSTVFDDCMNTNKSDSSVNIDINEVGAKAEESFSLGQYDQALPFYKQMLQKHIENDGYHHESVASDLHQIATCHVRKGHYDVARPLIEEAIRLKMALYGSDCEEVADSLHKLGVILVSNKEYSAALQTLYRALRIYRLEISSECAQVADIVFKIGCVHFQIKEYMAALMTFEEALELHPLIENRGSGVFIVEKTEILSHIGFVKIKLKQYGDAAILFEEALSLQRSKEGQLKSSALRTLDSLAYTYSKIGNFEKSVEMYASMMNIQEREFGPKSGSKTLTKMSMVLEQMKHFEAAISCRKKVLSLQVEKLGLNHEETQKTQDAIKRLISIV